MDEQTQLKDSILAQAHEKGRKLLEETKETILKEETAQEERLIQDKSIMRAMQYTVIYAAPWRRNIAATDCTVAPLAQETQSTFRAAQADSTSIAT